MRNSAPTSPSARLRPSRLWMPARTRDPVVRRISLLGYWYGWPSGVVPDVSGALLPTNSGCSSMPLHACDVRVGFQRSTAGKPSGSVVVAVALASRHEAALTGLDGLQS